MLNGVKHDVHCPSYLNEQIRWSNHILTHCRIFYLKWIISLKQSYINSLWPTYLWRHWSWPTLVKIMAWCPFGAKPLPSLMYLKMPSVDASVCIYGLVINLIYVYLYERDSYKSRDGTTVNASRRKINVQEYMFCMEHIFDKNTLDCWFRRPVMRPIQTAAPVTAKHAHTHRNFRMICMDFSVSGRHVSIQMLHVNSSGQ